LFQSILISLKFHQTRPNATLMVAVIEALRAAIEAATSLRIVLSDSWAAVMFSLVTPSGRSSTITVCKSTQTATLFGPHPAFSQTTSTHFLVSFGSVFFLSGQVSQSPFSLTIFLLTSVSPRSASHTVSLHSVLKVVPFTSKVLVASGLAYVHSFAVPSFCRMNCSFFLPSPRF